MNVPHGSATTAADRFRFANELPKQNLKLLATGQGGIAQAPEPLTLDRDQLDAGRGGAVVHEGVVVGILGRKAADDATLTIVPMTLLPETMRPRR